MMKLDDFKNNPQALKPPENATGISDENIDFLYRIVETIFERLLKKYESKILQFLLDRCNDEMGETSDPRQFHNDFDEEFVDNSNTPFEKTYY